MSVFLCHICGIKSLSTWCTQQFRAYIYYYQWHDNYINVRTYQSSMHKTRCKNLIFSYVSSLFSLVYNFLCYHTCWYVYKLDRNTQAIMLPKKRQVIWKKYPQSIMYRINHLLVTSAWYMINKIQ